MFLRMERKFLPNLCELNYGVLYMACVFVCVCVCLEKRVHTSAYRGG